MRSVVRLCLFFLALPAWAEPSPQAPAYWSGQADNLEKRIQKRQGEWLASGEWERVRDLVCSPGAVRDKVLELSARCALCNADAVFQKILSEECGSLKVDEWAHFLDFSMTERIVELVEQHVKAPASEAQKAKSLRKLYSSRQPIGNGKRGLVEQRFAAGLAQSCGEGKSPIGKNLDTLFPPTTDQGPFGICYAHAEAAVASAAVKRATGKEVDVSPEHGAVCSRLPGSEGASSSLLEGSSTEDALRHWLRKGFAVPRSVVTEDAGQLDAAVRAEEQNLSLIKSLPVVGSAVDGLNGASLVTTGLEARAGENRIPFSERDYDHEALWKLKSDEKSDPRFTCPLPDAEDLKRLSALTQNLCAGIPTLTRVVMKDVQTSADGGKTWLMENEKNRENLRHRMVLTGVEVIEGDLNFVFRNSWKAGDPKSQDPRARYPSKARLPFAHWCRIFGASVVRAPKDPGWRSLGDRRASSTESAATH